MRILSMPSRLGGIGLDSITESRDIRGPAATIPLFDEI